MAKTPAKKVAKRSTSQSVAFKYLDQVVERQTAAFYSAFSIGTADKKAPVKKLNKRAA